jgi:hypothetical protein
MKFNPLAALALMMASVKDLIFKHNMQMDQRGYYHRYTGHSKTFKKNKRKGL